MSSSTLVSKLLNRVHNLLHAVNLSSFGLDSLAAASTQVHEAVVTGDKHET